jgi:ElaB/YqjD/DUF883 family membrane-anchored ribosome-binding protein
MSHSSNMANHARRGAKQVRSAARHVRAVAEHEGNGLLHTAQRVGNEAVSAVKDGYEGLRDTAAEYIDEGRERVQTLERSVVRQVRQRPMTSVLLGLGFGFLAGIIFARR